MLKACARDRGSTAELMRMSSHFCGKLFATALITWFLNLSKERGKCKIAYIQQPVSSGISGQIILRLIANLKIILGGSASPSSMTVMSVIESSGN